MNTKLEDWLELKQANLNSFSNRGRNLKNRNNMMITASHLYNTFSTVS